MSPAVDPVAIKQSRADILARSDLAGRSLARRLCDQMDGWFMLLGATLPPGWALVATGGYGAGTLSPGSDIDVMLLHPPKASDAHVAEVAQPLWYPMWDAGLKLSPAVHSERTVLSLAAGDLVTATTLLRLRHLAGDHDLVESVRAKALHQWRKGAPDWLAELLEANEQRWARFGDVASLLEPDLKDGRGGLRDHDAVRWALALDRPEVRRALEGPVEDLSAAAGTLTTVRCEMQRLSGRASNVLHLQEQDGVAEALGYADADVLMLAVSAAARSIEWTSERFWARLERDMKRAAKAPKAPRGRTLIPGAAIVDDEVYLTPEIDLADQAAVFRVAAAAAHAGVRLGRSALLQLANTLGAEGEPWTERTRQAFVSLLGAGDDLVEAVEALEYYGLFSHLVPEWRHVRSRPQRNAFHVYTVDRHLLQTVANATALVREVSRPDLLLVAALLHDIGKGLPGDHTEVGMDLVGRMGVRMGFTPDDVATITALVEHHLLLPETATRRDLSDPRTAENVAALVGSSTRLELLHALTVADSQATGPSAWSPWKKSLIDELVAATAAVLRGHPPQRVAPSHDGRFDQLVARARRERRLCLEHEAGRDFDVVRIACADQKGLFAKIAGALALHGIDVVAADAWNDGRGIAADELRIEHVDSRDWQKVEHDLGAVIDGRVDIAARIEQRVRTYSRSHRRATAAAPPRREVLVSNDASAVTTVIDVRAPDEMALLYRLATALSARDLDIRSAKVATLGHEVVDVFYVQRSGRAGAARQVPERDHPQLIAELQACLARPFGSS